MKINNFQTDLEYSLLERENIIFNNFYYRVFPGLEHIEIVNFNTDFGKKLQKSGVDKILCFKSGYTLSIDEKKRREVYSDILLETWSVWEKRIRGWLYTCQCEYIVYVKMPIRKIYLLPVFLLKSVWMKNGLLWLNKYKNITAKNNGYVTKSVAIPDEILLTAIKEQMTTEFLEEDIYYSK